MGSRTLAHALVFALALASTAQAEPRACERASTRFAGVVAVGSFANDRGCVWSGYMLEGKRHALTESGLLLVRRGWASLDGNRRGALAHDWVADVMLDPGALLESAPPELVQKGAPRFAPTQSLPRPDGGVTLTAWQRLPSGMRPGARFARLEVVFGPDGNVTAVRSFDDYRAPRPPSRSR